jgi:hypothetical protein
MRLIPRFRGAKGPGGEGSGAKGWAGADAGAARTRAPSEQNPASTRQTTAARRIFPVTQGAEPQALSFS